MDEKLLLGPGWTESFESGETAPTLDVLLAMCAYIGIPLTDLMDGIEPDLADKPERKLAASRHGHDLLLHFPYGRHRAEVTLPDADVDEFERSSQSSVMV